MLILKNPVNLVKDYAVIHETYRTCSPVGSRQRRHGSDHSEAISQAYRANGVWGVSVLRLAFGSVFRSQSTTLQRRVDSRSRKEFRLWLVARARTVGAR